MDDEPPLALVEVTREECVNAPAAARYVSHASQGFSAYYLDKWYVEDPEAWASYMARINPEGEKEEKA